MGGQITAVCISGEKGVPKRNVRKGELSAGWGLVGDAHAGAGYRQVSMLSMDSLDREPFISAGLKPGDFAENLSVRGFNFADLKVGSLVSVGSQAVLQVSQIGKSCHHGCEF